YSYILLLISSSLLFFSNAPATPEIYTLSLHDALPISNEINETQNLTINQQKDQIRELQNGRNNWRWMFIVLAVAVRLSLAFKILDRKSTRLNSSHVKISYAVFCLKKKKKKHAVNYDSR